MRTASRNVTRSLLTWDRLQRGHAVPELSREVEVTKLQEASPHACFSAGDPRGGRWRRLGMITGII